MTRPNAIVFACVFVAAIAAVGAQQPDQAAKPAAQSDQAAKPTAAALARHQQLQGQLKQLLGRLDAALGQDLGALNKAVADAGIPPIIAVPFEKRQERNGPGG